MVNICGNAVKYTERGSVTLKVSADDGTVVFKIEDTGIGIPENSLKDIFDTFAQVDDTRRHRIKGTGLGLSISKQLAEMMSGSIKVDSAYEQGSIFTVTIPKVIGSGDLIPESKETAIEFCAPSAKILIVDDNEINLNVADGFLKLFGIGADRASSGAQAVDMVRQKDYDIVFMDYLMPDMDGAEATREIRKLGGEYERMKIIAFSANAVSGAKEMFFSSGFDDFLSKPIEFGKLTELLLKWLPGEKIESPPSEQAIKRAGSERK